MPKLCYNSINPDGSRFPTSEIYFVNLLTQIMSADKRGFASMDKDKQREIASKGGKAAHEKGTAHKFTSEEAREAGRKGGKAASKDRERMTEIGRKGGQSRKNKGENTSV